MRPRSPGCFGARAVRRAGLLLIGLVLASAPARTGGAAFAACDDPFPVFHANTGQADERFRFLSSSPEAILALAYDEAILIRNTGGPPAAISMKMIGARWRPRMVGLENRLGTDAAKTTQAVCLDARPSYAGVRYRDVYPGIDLVFHPGRGGFEFDFVLSAGTHPRPVRFELEGVESLSVDRLGNVLLNLPEPGGRMKLLRPTLFQVVDGERRAVEGGYSVQGDRLIGFEVGPYDRRLPLVIDPVLVYASSAAAIPETSGVLESQDGGRTWRAGGLAGRSVRSLLVDPVTSSTLYAGTQGDGVFKSLDGGRTWSSRNNRLASLTVNALAVDPKIPDRVYAGTSGGLYRSADGGSTWTAVGPNLPNPMFRSVAIDPETSSTTHYAADDVWVAKSVDEGATWTYSTVAGDHVTSLAIDPSSPETLYAGVFYATPRGGGVYKSVDGGFSWRLVSGSVVNPSGRQYDVNVVAVTPSGNSIVYAGTSGGGVFRSANGGTTWEAVNEGLGRVSVTALVIDPLSPTTLFAAVEGRGVFKSINGGRKWTEVTAGLGPLKPAALAIDPAHPERVFAGLLAPVPGAFAAQTDLAWNR